MLAFSPGMGLMIFHFARSSNSPFTCSRVAWSILDCACRTSTFPSCAFREQERHQATHPFFSFPPTSLSRGVARLSFTARVQRGPSEAARCVSKKDGLAAPLPFFL